MKHRVTARPLYAFYGDDFTGSTDVLEVLGIHGVASVLFTRIPTPRMLAAFSHCRAIGIAGESRSRNPAWMSRNLPAILRALRRFHAPLNQYKVCSTFDSSPRVGSVGRAIEIGRAVFGSQAVPVVVGAPRLGRAVIFANLFATAESKFYRIDRHPTMRRHPVTPMTEADLRLHLANQTSLRIGSVDLAAFQSDSEEMRFQAEIDAGAQAIVFDGFNDIMLQQAARLICNRAAIHPAFAVGSSGLTHGLLLHLRSLGLIPSAKPPAPANPVDRLLVLSGSCSPVTAKQIHRAKHLGFSTWRLQCPPSWRSVEAKALQALNRGQSVVLYTALGPQQKDTSHGERFGVSLGKLLRRIVLGSNVRRVLIAGGDTSTHAVKQLRLDALTFAAPLVPGVPLCRGHVARSPLDGIELALKGGQMGSEDFFAQVRDGGLS